MEVDVGERMSFGSVPPPTYTPIFPSTNQDQGVNKLAVQNLNWKR